MKILKYISAFILTVGLIPMWMIWFLADSAFGWHLTDDIMRKMWK